MGPYRQTSPLCFLNDSFIMLSAKLLKLSILNVNGNSSPGPVTIRTFEKRAPDSKFAFFMF